MSGPKAARPAAPCRDCRVGKVYTRGRCYRCHERRRAKAWCVCRACHRPRFDQGFGLCRGCRLRPEVRERFGIGRGQCWDAVADFYGPAPPPDEATDDPPGSPGKLAVLVARAAAGRALFHDDDCGMVEWRTRTRGQAVRAGRAYRVAPRAPRATGEGEA